MNNTDKARVVACQIHAIEIRNKTGAPYVLHPWRMVEWLRRVDWLTRERECIAWLHDIIENTQGRKFEVTHAALLLDFAPAIADAVELLSNIPGKHASYEDYILAVCTNPDAVAVKTADLIDNLSDCPSQNQIQRYARALGVLWKQP